MTAVELPRPVGAREVTSASGAPRLPRRRGRAGVLALLGLTAVTFVVLSPLLWAAMAATKSTQVAFADPPQFAYSPSLEAFRRLWLTTDFYSYFVNTVLIAVVSMVVTVFLAAPAAYALSRYSGRIGALILGAALIFRAVPGFAVALPFYDLARRFGIYDTELVVIIAFVALLQPFTIWLLRNFFLAIPRELDEAAVMDGCTPLMTFRYIMLPIMGPGLITAGIFTFLLAFQTYLVPLVLSDVDAKTLPVFLASQLGQTLPLLQQASAGIVLISLPIVLLALVTQRYLVSGLTSGAVKG